VRQHEVRDIMAAPKAGLLRREVAVPLAATSSICTIIVTLDRIS